MNSIINNILKKYKYNYNFKVYNNKKNNLLDLFSIYYYVIHKYNVFLIELYSKEKLLVSKENEEEKENNILIDYYKYENEEDNGEFLTLVTDYKNSKKKDYAGLLDLSENIVEYSNIYNINNINYSLSITELIIRNKTIFSIRDYYPIYNTNNNILLLIDNTYSKYIINKDNKKIIFVIFEKYLNKILKDMLNLENITDMSINNLKKNNNINNNIKTKIYKTIEELGVESLEDRDKIFKDIEDILSLVK